MTTVYLRVSDLTDSAKVKLDTVVKRFTFGMFARIIMRSPVDTGRFRAAWITGIGGKALSRNDDAKDRGIVTQDGSGISFTKDEMRDVVMNGKWIGGKIYLTNSLHYAYYLEYGRMFKDGHFGPASQQAPHGMVRITVNEYAQVLGQSMPYNLSEAPA